MLYYYRFSGGVVIVYERKVKLLYDDVTHLLAWKVKAVADPTLLPKGKNQARKEKITLPENQHIDFGDVEQSLNFTNAASTMGFEQPSYVAMIFIPIHRQKFQYLDSLKGRDPEVLKLLDTALPKELIRPLLPPNPYLISTKVDCNRLNDSAIQLLFRPSLRELYLHSCSDFSGKLLYEIGQSCPELRFVCNFSRSTRKKQEHAKMVVPLSAWPWENLGIFKEGSNIVCHGVDILNTKTQELKTGSYTI